MGIEVETRLADEIGSKAYLPDIWGNVNLDLSKLQVNKDDLPELKPLGPISDLPTEHINCMISHALSNLDSINKSHRWKSIARQVGGIMGTLVVVVVIAVLVYMCFIKPRFQRFAF